jgi:hypothetical protein
MDYQATMALRFVEREEESIFAESGPLLHPGIIRMIKRRVLQQFWTDTYGGGEWRDIPLADDVPDACWKDE